MRKKKGPSNALEIMHALFDGDNPETQEALRREREKIDIAQQIYDMRKSAGLTQKQLASMINTTPSVISRLEDADYESHSLSMLRRIAGALGYEMTLSFEDIEKGHKYHSDVKISHTTKYKELLTDEFDLNQDIFQWNLPGAFMAQERQSNANQPVAA